MIYDYASSWMPPPKKKRVQYIVCVCLSAFSHDLSWCFPPFPPLTRPGRRPGPAPSGDELEGSGADLLATSGWTHHMLCGQKLPTCLSP